MDPTGKLDLPLVLQRLCDSEIAITITVLPDGGFDFALISYMEWEEAGWQEKAIFN